MNLPAFCPEPATTTEETHLPPGLLFELILKRTMVDGTSSLGQLMTETKLDFGVVRSFFRNMQKEQLCETKGMVGQDYTFSLTGKGVRMAEEAYRKNQYCGPAPVRLADYCEAVRQQALRPEVTPESLSEHLADITVQEDLIRDLGAALMTGGAIFLYGPTGNGKTSIAERLQRIFADRVYIPYAVEVSGHILNIYDGVVHRPAMNQPEDIDQRWVLCERPFLKVGGELRAEMLEPRIDDLTRISVAPLQMQANNGILVIDDFGRQNISPRDLLNRWIVPLDRRVDYYSLWSGVRFEVPFEVMVVFATNLELRQLAEEAFIRRIKNKIKIDAVYPATFSEILRKECGQYGIALSPEMQEHTYIECSRRAPEGLRACYPHDLIEIVRGIAAFERRAAVLEKADLDKAVNLYFAR